MFSDVGFGEVVVLLLVAILVVGPERLPRYAAEAGRMLRRLRDVAKGAQENLRTELGPDFADVDIRDLHPRRFVQKHLFDDDDEPVGRGRVEALAEGERPPYDADAT
jgi:sec-independent protein translocase protein TatB